MTPAVAPDVPSVSKRGVGRRPLREISLVVSVSDVTAVAARLRISFRPRLATGGIGIARQNTASIDKTGKEVQL